MPFFIYVIKSLYIKDYALIEELEVQFEPGLNIITGETGAGKSILLGALQLLMGSRASTETVRTGASKAIVEGVFDMHNDGDLRAVLNEIGADQQDVIIVRREVTDSYSRAFVNDTPVNLAILKSLADLQIDLHGQHQHQSLLREETHRLFLDQLGQLGEQLSVYRTSYDRVNEVTSRITKLMHEKAVLEKSRELSEFQLKEIDALEARVGEEDELNRELSVLDNAEKLQSVTGGIYNELYEDDGAIVDRLDKAHKELESILKHDQSLLPLASELRSAIIALQELATSLNEYAGSIDLDPARLDAVRERLGSYEILKRKYGGTIEDVLEFAETKRKEVELVENFDAELDGLQAERSEELEVLQQRAIDLSNRRKETARLVEKEIVRALKELDIKQARFEVRFEHETEQDGWVKVADNRKVKATSTGIDTVTFYISTNPGEDVKPLVEVASGGEISRVMLAMKSILANTGGIPLMVFDEIDVGISGRIAQQVGWKLRELSERHQVISITHLPQIAAMADRHFVVEKEVVDGRTRSQLRTLSDDERAGAIASLIGGKKVTDAAVISARELIDSVREHN